MPSSPSRIRAIPADGPFGVGNVAEKLLGHVSYVLCRALHPDTVVETGVAHGGMTTNILTALAANKRGVLHSIDLPSIMDRNARSRVPSWISRNKGDLEYAERMRVLRLGVDSQPRVPSTAQRSPGKLSLSGAQPRHQG
jgi:hypothetical protein